MGYKIISVVFVCMVLSCGVFAQENASPRIPSSILECYQNSTLLQRDLRLPSTMPMLIDLIRRVENHPNMVNRDMREVVIQLIHRFKLDGIQKSTKISASSGVVPYSPTAFQFYKHQIGLRELLPGNAYSFPNETLTAIERCSLHHMMSSTIELEVRNDEGTVCNRLSQYRTQRIPREVREDLDVEVLDPNLISQLNEKGQMQLDPEVENDDAENVDIGIGIGVGPRNMENTVSQCPVEDGVVYSQWGAVAVGPLLSGIAAGLQVTRVQIKELSSKVTSYSGLTVDNRFAVTLAGDMGEATLLQGTVNTDIRVGASGAWNSTQAPRWFFLSQSTNNEITDAEIRGGLDGLILAFNMQTLKQKASSMRLSQLLEMYYSQRGVFSTTLRACNRQANFNEYAPTETTLNQVIAMSLLLDEVSLLQGTIIDDGHQTLSTKTVNALRDYIPSSLTDLSCAVTSSNDAHGDVDIRANVTIVMDKAFLFKDIEATIIDILHKVNTGLAGSSVMIISASEGKVICDSTDSLANITQCFNQDNYNTMPERVDMYKVLESLRDLQRYSLANETNNRWSGGLSSVVLFVMSQVAIDEGTYSADMLKLINELAPDSRFIFFTTGNKDRFNNLVRDSTNDIYTFTISTNTESQVKEVISRVSQIPKRIINYRCGPDYTTTDLSSDTYTGYVAPQKINYYRLHPNYFFKNNADTYIRVTGTSSTSLTLCYSRSTQLPRSNTTGNDGTTCSPLTASAQEISLRDACNGNDYIHQCPPLYFSIEAGAVGDFSSAQICTERACPQADNLKYTVNTHNLGCFSGAVQISLSLGLIVVSLFVTIKSL